MSQPLSLPVFFENGKMDADFEVKEGYVIGLCVLYAQRAAKEQEYMIRNRSIVAIGDRDLSECVQMAKDLACNSALTRLSQLPAVPAALAQKPVQQEPKPEIATSSAAAVVTAQPDEPASAENPASTANSGEEGSVPSKDAERSAEPLKEKPSILAGARQVEFADLRPASALLAEESVPQQSNASEPDEEDTITKAKDMKITILGKLHECSGWTAGKILEERPEVIVEFANRYNGPKVEERDALRALYTEALRRVNRAA